jgi:hypothetical protein
MTTIAEIMRLCELKKKKSSVIEPMYKDTKVLQSETTVCDPKTTSKKDQEYLKNRVADQVLTDLENGGNVLGVERKVYSFNGRIITKTTILTDNTELVNQGDYKEDGRVDVQVRNNGTTRLSLDVLKKMSLKEIESADPSQFSGMNYNQFNGLSEDKQIQATMKLSELEALEKRRQDDLLEHKYDGASSFRGAIPLPGKSFSLEIPNKNKFMTCTKVYSDAYSATWKVEMADDDRPKDVIIHLITYYLDGASSVGTSTLGKDNDPILDNGSLNKKTTIEWKNLFIALWHTNKEFFTRMGVKSPFALLVAFTLIGVDFNYDDGRTEENVLNAIAVKFGVLINVTYDNSPFGITKQSLPRDTVCSVVLNLNWKNHKYLTGMENW